MKPEAFTKSDQHTYVSENFLFFDVEQVASLTTASSDGRASSNSTLTNFFKIISATCVPKNYVSNINEKIVM